jgi:hypothetical protein
MGEYRIAGSFKLIGAFWKPGQPDASFTGTLTSRNGGVEALSSPLYTNKLGEEAVREEFKALFSDRDLKRIPALQGFTTDNRCTLLNVLVLEGGGNTNFPTGQKLSALRYIAARTVMGLHLGAADEESLDSGSLYFTKFHHLLPTPWLAQTNSDSTSYNLPHQSKEVFKFTSAEIDAEVICEVFAGGSLKAKKGASIKPVPRIRIIPKTPRSADWFTALAFRIENFISLFLGTSLSVKRIQLFRGVEKGWVVQKINHREEKVSLQMWVRTTYGVMADALKRWLAAPVENRPVELTVLGMLRKSTLFDETEFLSLAQALEGFGRIRFTSGNKKTVTYASLIEQSYDLLSVDFAKQLLGERAEFVKKLVQTRNYYTHLGSPKGAAATQDGRELFLLNKRLQAFIRCVMLIDLGVPEQHLKEPILYQSTRWRLS